MGSARPNFKIVGGRIVYDGAQELKDSQRIGRINFKIPKHGIKLWRKNLPKYWL
jgi:hypothetical protein